MLAVFDLPFVPNQFQQSLGPGFLGPKTGHFISDFFGVFDDLAAAERMKGSVLNIDTTGFSSSHFRFRRCLDKKFDTCVHAPI